MRYAQFARLLRKGYFLEQDSLCTKKGCYCKEGKNSDKKIAKAILGGALLEPLKQIQENAGIENDRVYNQKSIGLDVKSGKEGDLIEMGIIDPLKVTKQALQNAVSVAVTILSTNAIVTMARSIETQ